MHNYPLNTPLGRGFFPEGLRLLLKGRGFGGPLALVLLPQLVLLLLLLPQLGLLLHQRGVPLRQLVGQLVGEVVLLLRPTPARGGGTGGLLLSGIGV